jgi:hypothetical protein
MAGSWVDGRWVGPLEAQNIAARKQAQQAYKKRLETARQATYSFQAQKAQEKQNKYFQDMASYLKPMVQPTTQPYETPTDAASTNYAGGSKTFDESTGTYKTATSTSPIGEVAASKNLFGDYSKEEVDSLRKLLSRFKSNPEIFKSIL